MLRLEGLTIAQGDFRLAAEMSLAEGQKYAVIGPSGAGKSTLLGALCGFVPLVGGKLLWNDTDITDAVPGARPMTMLFQDYNLFPHLSVTQNVGLGMRPDLRLSADQKTRVEEALVRVGLGDQMRKKPGALSGGQQSRAACWCRRGPGCCWTNLLPLSVRRVSDHDQPSPRLLDLVRQLVEETGAGLIMVTHAPEDVRRIADEVIFVGSGRAEAPRPAAALMDNPPPELKAYLG